LGFDVFPINGDARAARITWGITSTLPGEAELESPGSHSNPMISLNLIQPLLLSGRGLLVMGI